MTDPLTGAQKAAILVSLLDEQAASKLLQHLQEDEVRAIAAEIAKVDMIDPSRHEAVMAEFQSMVRDMRGLELAGRPKARRLLQALQPEAAERLIREIDPPRIPDVDEEGIKIDPPQLPEALVAAPARRLAVLLRDEPPQTVALILAHLPSRKSARLLATMEPARRTEVTRRMAGIREVRPEIVERVGAALEERLAALGEDPFVSVDGIRIAADALTGLGRANGQEIVESLGGDYPELADQLRDLLFTFDLLNAMNDRDTQEVLKQVDRGTLALALKGADPSLQDTFYRNMSERAGQMLREEMEFLGAPRLSEIEQAQRSIIDLVLRLEKEGAIQLEEETVAAG